MNFPVIDFGSFALDKPEPSANEMNRLSTEVANAINEIGFMYFKNIGINDEQVFETMDICRKFFLLPKDIKEQYACVKSSDIPHHGWQCMSESLIPEHVFDLKETFNLSVLASSETWPIKEAPEFSNRMESFFRILEGLSIRIMKVIALTLGVEPDFFLSRHQKIGSISNPTTIRAAYYPPIQKSFVKENQARCGEHCDYGTFTLLFQDKNGGLEVMSKSGQFIDAPYIPNTVLFMPADFLQRWTSDRWIATKHRIQIPQTEEALNRARQSIGFFYHPDHDATVVCCDGLNKYPPIICNQYLKNKYPHIFYKESYPSIA
ncbi:uncharacterized protein [Narcine bancroftii]|uniref:uncharacterized protein n=1 Tax=Narcine bancroftii TaxID=1343680 RepID=UPI003831A85D